MKISELKLNILILDAIGAVVLMFLAWVFPEQGDLVINAAAAMIGGNAAVMKDLLTPDPNPSVPASLAERLVSMVEKLKGGGR